MRCLSWTIFIRASDCEVVPPYAAISFWDYSRKMVRLNGFSIYELIEIDQAFLSFRYIVRIREPHRWFSLISNNAPKMVRPYLQKLFFYCHQWAHVAKVKHSFEILLRAWSSVEFLNPLLGNTGTINSLSSGWVETDPEQFFQLQNWKFISSPGKNWAFCTIGFR